MDQSPAAAAQRLVFNKLALISAIKAGNTKTVLELLDRGIPIDTKDDEGMSLLHWAAWGGHVTTMRLFIRRGCDVDSVDGRRLTPLHCAAAMGQTKAARELIRKGALKSVVAGIHGTPLHQAAYFGHVETAVAMLEEGCPLDVVNSDGATVLHFVAAGGNVKLVRELVSRGCDGNAVQSDGCTPLHHAAGRGRTKAVRELIKLGARKSVVAGNFGTPLHQAVLNGRVKTAVAMLEEGCPLDIVDSAEATVLHSAAASGNVELVKELVGRGCDVNVVEADGSTPLHSAANRGRTEAVRELIKLGARKSVVAGYCGTPLHQAALNGHVETAVAMLEEGCPLDVVSGAGATVLHSAAAGGNVELVKELVGRGCDVNAVEADGSTPLLSAANRGRTEAVRELIKLGARKSIVAGNFGTPLHQAALNGHVETAVAMLEEGCPLDVVDSAEATVLHSAAAGGNVKLVRELVSRGCDVNAVKANGCTPLHSAANRGRTEAVRELIKLGAQKSVVAGNFGTPLHQVALNGHVETAVAMLEEGCPFDVVSGAGATVLHFTAAGGNVELVKELVGRGSDVNAVEADGSTPLHSAAGHGRTEAVRELIKLGATKSVVAGDYGSPLHQAVMNGHVKTVEALLEDELYEPDMVSHDVSLSKEQVLDSGIIGTCDSVGQTPVMWAVECGQVEALKLLISKGGLISDRDTLSLSVFEHCFVGGQASKLSQFCEASGLGNSGDGLEGALTTLITRRLIDAHKVLCLCAISGDNVFLEDQIIELVASDACAMPAAVKCAKYYFCEGEGVLFLNQLRIPDVNILNPLHTSLLSLKCYERGFAIDSIKTSIKDHTSFITKLLSHPVLKETVHENFPNGLSPLDLARQFELHHIAALIQGAGGHPGVWAGVPQEIELRHPLALPQVKEAYASIKSIAEDGEHGCAFIRHLLSSVLSKPLSGRPPLYGAEQSSKDGILRQKPTLSRLARLIMSHMSCHNWRLVGLLLLEDIVDAKDTLNAISHQCSDDRNRFLETLSFWLEHGSSVTWKTLLDVLGHFETKHTVDELTDKIVSVTGGGDQVVAVSGPFRPVSSSAPVVSGGAVAAERNPPVYEAKQVLGDFRDQFIADVDANTVVWGLLHKNIIPRGVQERISRTDEPKQQNEILHDCLQRTCTKKALMEVCDIIMAVRGHPKMRELGESMKRRLHIGIGFTKCGSLKPSSSPSLDASEDLSSPCPVQTLREGGVLSEHPLVKASPVQVVQDHAEEFLEKMNSKVLAPQLKALELIPEPAECDILQSKSREEANAHLLNHLKEDADEESVREVFRIASEKTGYGKMKAFAAGMLRELQ